MHIKAIYQKIYFFFRTYKFSLLGAFAIIASGLLLAIISKKNHRIKSPEYGNLEIIDCNRALYSTIPITSQRKLNDDNDTHLLHAQANGLQRIYISNQSFEEDSALLVRQNCLVRLNNNPLYHLKDLTHSYPYATPETAQLLNDIGLLFRQKLREVGKDHYRLLITSALRTNETQSNLSSRNRNAHTQSAHLYGTTIDITYKEFYNTKTGLMEQSHYPADALRKTMLDMREQCRLVVVRERRQACYHFTVVNCDPAKIPQDSISSVPLFIY